MRVLFGLIALSVLSCKDPKPAGSQFALARAAGSRFTRVMKVHSASTLPKGAASEAAKYFVLDFSLVSPSRTEVVLQDQDAWYQTTKDGDVVARKPLDGIPLRSGVRYFLERNNGVVATVGRVDENPIGDAEIAELKGMANEREGLEPTFSDALRSVGPLTLGPAPSALLAALRKPMEKSGEKEGDPAMREGTLPQELRVTAIADRQVRFEWTGGFNKPSDGRFEAAVRIATKGILEVDPSSARVTKYQFGLDSTVIRSEEDRLVNKTENLQEETDK